MRKFKHDTPGAFTIVLQIVSGAIAGLLIAGAYLALKPVKLMDASAAAKAAESTDTERNVVGYVRGNPGHPSGQQWRLRERAFLAKDAGGVALSEEDINRWVYTTYGAADRKVELKSYGFVMVPSLPIVRVSDSDFQVGMEFDCAVGDAKKTIVAQAHGRFEKDGNRHVFVPTRVYLGSCPLPGPLGSALVARLGGAFQAPEEVASTWASVTAAKLEESRLKLAFN